MYNELKEVWEDFKSDLAAINGGTVYDYKIIASEKMGFIIVKTNQNIKDENTLDSVYDKYGTILDEYGMIIYATLVNPREVRHDKF